MEQRDKALQLINDLIASGVTQTKIANMLDTNPTQITRWVKRRHEISPAWANVIVSKLGD